MKKIKLSLLILILVLSILVFASQVIATVNPEDYKPEDLQQSDVGVFETFGGKVAGIIQVVGTIVSVGVMMLLGIRYMIASADEKAEYRERIIPYLIGAALLFAASNIVNMIYEMFAN